ncbi:hypothetical protein PLESTB_000862900 [Pleodorina starrii]|uniref:Protein kinase domain-containing protein n=1 Tax=Pleodorina starrii TaxID=330485 RepID=A0A9W6BMF4_9CHLO|nr:hypothetical protein PLESTM_001431100 [Pleodorina starrii]GLC54430.1 hypothetical protein PLESTB_000862900 [Pleodorina starrii]GLC72085.1 hypothetical protein PLESTF_001202300 [Pleodorina starrii]
MPSEIARIVASQHEPGVYYVDRDTWQVGTRYELTKVLGTGSFSAVCLACDRLEGDKVALKRVGDVFASPDNAKRVLREVCIMRRLEHPNIIRLRDVFLKPSPTGKYVFRGGRLVPTSYDCYMAMEYCDQGDMFNMRGQLPEHEVRSLMWQLLSALRYLHGLNVWHRDIKTGNLLLTLHEGRRVLKVADFGSARSAKDAGDTSNGGPGLARQRNGGEGRDIAEPDPSPPPPPLGSFDGMDLEEGDDPDPVPASATARRLDSARASRRSDGGGGAERCCSGRRPPRSGCSASAGPGGDGGGLVAVPAPDGGYQPPLTSLVCTPCYRAPEVVMSRGGYSSAIDMWSAGCVFGELLQRAAYLGKASTPHLQVAPVFAITGKPLTPHAGQRYGVTEPGGSASAFAELSALFSVIGTPAWACIEAVRSEAWRRYLFHVPGRAPTLYRRFGQAGEVAVDLLARLLQFDPVRRASAEEVMAHEYFAMMHMEAQMAATGIASQADAATATATKTTRLPASIGPGWQRSHRHRRSASPGDGDDEASAKPPAVAPRSSPSVSRRAAPLPMWPPGRSPPPQRGSGSGGAGLVSDMEVEGDVEGGAGRAAAVTVGQGSGLGGPEALTSGTPLPARRIHSSRPCSAGGCGSLLAKRKQLELEGSSGDEEDMMLGEARPQQPPPQSFWQIDEPALALAALEAELGPLVPDASNASLPSPDRARAATASQTPEALAFVEECKERLRVMLERECAEHAARAAARRGAPPEGRGGTKSSAGDSATVGSGSGGGGGGGGSFRRNNSDGFLVGPDGQILGGAGGAAALHGHLRPDPGQQLDPSIIGYERVPYHADAAAARLEPEKHLWAGRHGEWTQSSLAAQRREAAGGTWGVTLMPPGLDAGTPAGKAMLDAVRSQQGR